MVMELVEGRQLREMIATGPLEIRAAHRSGAGRCAGCCTRRGSDPRRYQAA
jgi:hypothetical protein